MYTLLSYTNSTATRTQNDSDHGTFADHSSSSSATDNVSSIILIMILSVLSILGVIFMIFGPMMRSEAWKRVDNYIFGQDSDNDRRDDVGAETDDA